MINKRIIIVGPSASGKNFLRDKFIKKGFIADISYTTRESRENEKDGVDYHFISSDKFWQMITAKKFYEWIEYKGHLYGTGKNEWEENDIFIMESIGISKIKSEDRKECIIFFIDPPLDSRIKRMSIERKWKWHDISKRLDYDAKCFDGFKDYDVKITNSDF